MDRNYSLRTSPNAIHRDFTISGVTIRAEPDFAQENLQTRAFIQSMCFLVIGLIFGKLTRIRILICQDKISVKKKRIKIYISMTTIILIVPKFVKISS